VMIDSALPYYETGSRVSGSITSIGSDTMHNLMDQWFERYERFYPKVAIELGANSTARGAMDFVGVFETGSAEFLNDQRQAL